MIWRNPKYNSVGTIDCEIEHPDLGWIPFTATREDQGATFDVGAMIDEIEAGEVAPYVARPLTREDVNRERDIRTMLPFTFEGRWFDNDPVSKQRIAGAASLAGFAMGAGAQPGDLFWHGGQTPFSWITAGDEIIQLDAQKTFALGQAAAAYETGVVFAASALKNNPDGIVTDFRNGAYWP